MASMATWDEHRVRHDSPVPLYRQIEYAIARLIDVGDISPRTNLPSEARLAELYGVSRLTVRQALGELRRKGLVESRQGKGTFVSSPGQGDVPCLSSFTETALRSGHVPTSQLISFGEVIDRQVARDLDLDESQPLIRVVRLRSLDGIPVYLSFASIPTSFGRTLRASDFPEFGLEQSLYQSLERSCGLHLRVGEETVSARLASKAAAPLLGVRNRAPLVERTCIMRIADGRRVVSERTLWAQMQQTSVRLVWSGTR